MEANSDKDDDDDNCSHIYSEEESNKLIKAVHSGRNAAILIVILNTIAFGLTGANPHSTQLGYALIISAQTLLLAGAACFHGFRSAAGWLCFAGLTLILWAIYKNLISVYVFYPGAILVVIIIRAQVKLGIITQRIEHARKQQ